MEISYDYNDLIDEIEEEIAFGNLNKSDMIQVLRRPLLRLNYSPIVDWHYAHEIAMGDFDSTSLFDSKEEKEEKQHLKRKYLEVQDLLEQISVADCLTEMRQKNSLFDAPHK